MSTQPIGDSDASLGGDADADLQALVSAALDLREQGRANWLQHACREHPELEERVRILADRAHALPRMLSQSATFDPLIGLCLGGRFQLRERIGAGAMGVVYAADDRELKRRVACKLVRHGLMAPQQVIERFDREARAMAAVRHPAVVAIHDRGCTEDDQVYIVMELVDGVSLSDLLEAATRRAETSKSDDSGWLEAQFGIVTRGESSYLRTVVRWTADLALGLEAVHVAGVLHRDIKPSNILVRRDGGPALLDFGIALLEETESITRGITSIGTPAYMPPEALQREVKRTPSSDVYGLAATLYHLLTLHAPYEGSPTQILTALATREPIPASTQRPGLPRDLQAILDKGMHRNPDARYASAAAFEADLRAFLEFRPITARPVSGVERVARRLVRSRVAWGAFAALLLVAVLAGAHAWREQRVEARRAQHAEIARHIPPNFSVVGLANRVIRDEADRAALSDLLDEAERVAVEPLPTGLLRASFRQDHGDAAGAASDMRVVADHVGTPFAKALAERYAVADASKSGVRSLDLDGLPPAETPVDRYLLAYHSLRQEKVADAIRLLSDAEVRRIPHAEELYLVTTNFDGAARPEKHRLALERYAELVRLESRIGGRTATTAHIAGRMLAVQGRFEEAELACEEGIELAPRSHVLRINAGYSAFAGHRLAEARGHLLVARELRPNYAHVAEDLVWVEIADRRFDAAQQLIRESEPGFEPKNASWGEYWSGVISTYAALDARACGEKASCAGNVLDALTSFARVPKRTHDADGIPKDTAFRIATALSSDDEQALVLALAKLLEQEPDNWWRQELLAVHMPSDLAPEATDALRRVIESQSTRTISSNSK